MQNLGKINNLPLREAWSLEPSFTKWLAEDNNLNLLAEEIGIDIELVQIEASVGNFNVDILAKESSTESLIIIENQLEMTDHDHLGKLLTYAAGHSAEYVIWIFKDMREEHRSAIDWLNDNTVDGVKFFAIKLELWKIGESLPAPKFEILCRPNNWAKTLKATRANSGEITETKMKQMNFWQNFVDYASVNEKSLRFHTPAPQHWLNMNIGTSLAHVSLTVNTREKRLGVELYIRNDKELFSRLKDNKTEIEAELGEDLEWIEANLACRVLQVKMNFDLNNENSHEEEFNWLVDRALKFKSIFSVKIKELG
jgi:hypothetical protein